MLLKNLFRLLVMSTVVSAMVACVASRDDIKNLESKIEQSNARLDRVDDELSGASREQLPQSLCLYSATTGDLTKRVYGLSDKDACRAEGHYFDDIGLNATNECHRRSPYSAARETCLNKISGSEEDVVAELQNNIRAVIYQGPTQAEWADRNFGVFRGFSVGCYLPCDMTQ